MMNNSPLPVDTDLEPVLAVKAQWAQQGQFTSFTFFQVMCYAVWISASPDSAGYDPVDRVLENMETRKSQISDWNDYHD